MLARIVLFIAISLFPSIVHADQKVALLIGNAIYSDTSATLRNPLNDVAILRDVLERADFKVDAIENADRSKLTRALASFAQIASEADIALIYYSGHGIEINGENYLVPVDATLASELDIEYETVAVKKLFDALSGTKKFKLVLLDACRDNPLLAKMKLPKTRGGSSKGLARVESAESNLLIGYATAPGDVALDGDGENSPYASALARHLVTPGREIEIALRAVAKDVYEATKGKQRPYITGSLFETVMLGPVTNMESSTDPCQGAAAQWDAISQRGDKRLFEEYLRLYPACTFSSLAKAEIEAIEKFAARPSPDQDLIVPNGATVEQVLKLLAGDLTLKGELPKEAVPEGELLPGSYQVQSTTSRANLLDQMRAAHESLVSQIWDQRDNNLPITTRDELVILASIVEKEGKGRAEQLPHIAEVYLNRIRRGMRLQSDQTLIYGLYGGAGLPADKVITVTDLQKSTPYNTYKINGIPPTPIANPGRLALEAVAHPSNTNALFFTDDGEENFAFASTLEEHNKNVRNWRKKFAAKAN